MTQIDGKKPIYFFPLNSGLQCRHTTGYNFAKLSLQFSIKTVFPCVLCWDHEMGWDLGREKPPAQPTASLTSPTRLPLPKV